MRKYVIGLIAAAIGASSAIAGQGHQQSQLPIQNYSAAASASHQAFSSFQKAHATTHTGSFRLHDSSKNSASAKLSKPAFVWASGNLQPAITAPIKGSKIVESAAREYLLKQGAVLQLSKGVVNDAKMMHLHDLGKGPLIARFQQTHNGLEVFGQQMNVLMGRDMKLIATSGSFAPQDSAASFSTTGKTASSARAGVAADAFTLSPERAIGLAFGDFSKQTLNTSGLSLDRVVGDYSFYKMAGTQKGEIGLEGQPRAKKVYYYLDGKYLPAWYVEVGGRSIDGANSYGYGYVVSAVDGKVLFRKDQIDYDYSYNVYADTTGINQPFDSPLGNSRDPFVGTPPSGFSNFEPIPRAGAATNLVTLDHGPISTNDPWLPAGATATTGNNVDAYLDLFGTADLTGNVLSGDGFQAATTDRRAAPTSNSFNFPYTPDADPSTQSQGNFAIVNLFYLNNWLHDWWYDNGFNEAAGNAQASNFGRGGEEGDGLLAEGQDFSGRDNANERTPADGGSPRQQMYLFDGQAVLATVRGIAPAFGDFEVGTASFGPRAFDITGTIVESAPLNGCTSFTNAAAVAGKVVLVDRGTCSFQSKTLLAQAAGAAGVILADNRLEAPPGLGVDTATPTQNPTIGTLSITQADGVALHTAINAGPTTARFVRDPGIDIDGTLDIQIIAHEWFHTTSNRLVGNANGLSNQQGRGMGEGWSDMSALLLTVRPEDKLVAGNSNYEGAYPEAYYATRDTYFGIRRAPYSTSFAVNPLTFQYISEGVPLPTTAPISFGQNGVGNSEVHSTGEIWCNTLWEIYASLLNDPRYSFVQARERMKSYIIAGLMMTPNAPTLLDARDALLAAARATDTTGADYQLMLVAFAKRGMGAFAVAPDRNSATNANAIEDFTVSAGKLTVTNAALDFSYINGAAGFIDNDGVLDPGETALMTVTVVNSGTAAITTPLIGDLTSDGDVTFGNGAQLSFPASVAAPIGIGQTATATVEVKLNSATSTAQALNLTVSFEQSGADPDTVGEPTPISFDLFVNYDVKPNTMAADNFEQPLSSVRDWSAVLLGNGLNWTLTDANGLIGTTGTGWFANDNTAPTDVLLTTPVLSATAGFSLAFDHYFSFEFAGTDGAGNLYGYDGGVIEVSSDAGATWTDVVDAGGTFTGGVGYNGFLLSLGPDGILTPDDSGQHAGFVRDNGSINARVPQHVVLSLPDSFAGQQVLLRFREATDAGGSSFGWFVDNVSFTGISNLPFSTIVADDGVPDNQPPVANAGPDQVVGANRPGTLDGTASTDDVGVTAYAWTQLSGTPVALTGADTATPTFTAPASAATLVFQLTARDVRTASSSDTVTVTVPPPPIANAGPDQRVNIRNSVVLDGNGSTTNAGSGINFAWVQTSGPVASLSGANTNRPTFKANDIGTLVFQLTVTDTTTGATSTASTSVVVGVPKGGGSFGILMFLPGLLALALRRRRDRRA